MKADFKRALSLILIFVFSLALVAFIPYNSHAEIQKHYLGSAVNTGRNNGYSGENEIGEKDPHFGWELGRFSVSGYTRRSGDKDTPVFIRTIGDEITLQFNLEQDIDRLGDNDRLVIAEDKNGSDKYFGIEKTNFGRGALIIRHTDWQNNKKMPEDAMRLLTL